MIPFGKIDPRKLFTDNLYAISLYSRQIAGTFVLLFIARYLSVYDYGLFSSYKSLAMLCLLAANLGFNDYILVSSQKIVKEVQLKIALFVLNALLLLLLVILISFFLPLESNIIFILVLIRTFLDGTFFNLMLPYYQASGKFNLISWINIFYSIMTIIIAITSYILKLSLIKFLILSIILGIFNFVQVTYFTKINYCFVIKYFKKLIKKIDKSILPYCLYNLEWYLFNQTPSLYAAIFIAKKDTAVFFAAYTIANIISVFISAFVQKLMPELINVPLEKIESILKEKIFSINFITIFIFTILCILGHLLLTLIYEQPYYQNSYYPLLLLSIGNIFLGWATPYGVYITTSGNQKRKTKIQLYTILVTLFALILLHKTGIYAACFAYMFSLIYMCVAYKHNTKIIINTLKRLEVHE